MKRSDSIMELAKAMAKFQEEVENPNNDATNPQYRSKYATLANVINTVKPILAKNGLSFIQSPATLEDGLHISITTILLHQSGEWIESEPLTLPAFKLGKDSVKIYDAQAAGIAISYGRRYSLSSILGISSEDDDDANGIKHEANSKNKGGQQSQPPNNYSKNNNNTKSSDNKNNSFKPITDNQKKAVNAAVKEFAQLSEKKTEDVITALEATKSVGKFVEVSAMSSGQASTTIALVNKWIKDKKAAQGGAQ